MLFFHPHDTNHSRLSYLRPPGRDTPEETNIKKKVKFYPNFYLRMVFPAQKTGSSGRKYVRFRRASPKEQFGE